MIRLVLMAALARHDLEGASQLLRGRLVGCSELGRPDARLELPDPGRESLETPLEDVVPVAADEAVLAVATLDGVVPAEPEDEVVSVTAGQDVIALGPHDEGVVVQHTRAFGREVRREPRARPHLVSLDHDEVGERGVGGPARGEAG